MARITLKQDDAFLQRLSRMERAAPETAKRALYQGAKVVADAMRRAVEELPEDKHGFGSERHKLTGPRDWEKRDLEESLGVTPIREENGTYHVKIGFDGYGSRPTRKYPKGVPNQMVARAIESGSSFRSKIPFVRRTAEQNREKAVEAMRRTIGEREET